MSDQNEKTEQEIKLVDEIQKQHEAFKVELEKNPIEGIGLRDTHLLNGGVSYKVGSAVLFKIIEYSVYGQWRDYNKGIPCIRLEVDHSYEHGNRGLTVSYRSKDYTSNAKKAIAKAKERLAELVALDKRAVERETEKENRDEIAKKELSTIGDVGSCGFTQYANHRLYNFKDSNNSIEVYRCSGQDLYSIDVIEGKFTVDELAQIKNLLDSFETNK